MMEYVCNVWKEQRFWPCLKLWSMSISWTTSWISWELIFYFLLMYCCCRFLCLLSGFLSLTKEQIKEKRSKTDFATVILVAIPSSTFGAWQPTKGGLSDELPVFVSPDAHPLMPTVTLHLSSGFSLHMVEGLEYMTVWVFLWSFSVSVTLV